MLKSLELHGFKSFADKTIFEFSTGITGVVGPNGSGKSNVVDGIKWILGDQSAKSLRGKEMTDVIFNGSSGRKASNFSEASLLFDNSARFFPIEFDEVHIGRKLWRNGDSEYLINHAPARLKDIKRLFLNSSAGTAEYCIIEQGRVEQILQASAQNRRRIFEEAAGISLFKSRKIEFLRRMERVEQHLLRLQDIVEEVESQLLSLKSQAEKAAKYREVSTELRALWIGLSADEYRELDLGFRDDSTQLEKLLQKISVLQEKQSVQDRELHSIESQIQMLEKDQRGIDRKRTRYLESIARNQTVVSQSTSRLREIAVDRTRMTKQETLLENRYREISEEFELNREILNRHEDVFASKEKEVEKIVAESEIEAGKIVELRENIELCKTEEEEIRSRLAELEIAERNSESEYRAALAAKESNARDVTEVERQHEDLLQNRQEIESDLNAIENLHREIAEKIESTAKQRKVILEKQSNRIRDLSVLREQKSAALARKNILEVLDKKQEGIGIGAKEILNRSRTSPLAPWSDILGTVAELLEVDFSYAAVIEAALGERAQWIVTRSLQSFLDHLQQESPNIQGRVTFIDLNRGETWHRLAEDRIATQESSDSPVFSNVRLANEQGVVSRADKLFDAENENIALIGYLLGDTWVVETLEDAVRLAKKSEHGTRFVTMQGELLSSNGVAVLGSIHAEESLISRRSELRQIKSELTIMELQIVQESNLLNSQDSDLLEIEKEIAQLEMTSRDKLEQRAVVCEKLKRVQGEQDNNELAIDEIKRDQENIDETIEELSKHLKSLGQTREVELSHIQNIQEQAIRKENEIATLESSIEECETRIQKAKINLVQLEEQRKNSDAAFQKLEAELDLRCQQSEEATRRLGEVKNQLQKIHMEVLLTESQLAESFLCEEDLEFQLKRRNDEKQEWAESRRHLRTADAELQKQRRTLEEAKMTIEMRSRNVEQQQKLLEERIEEEFQESLAEFVNTGESALVSYLQSQSEEKLDDETESQIDLHESSSNELSILEDISDEEKTKIRQQLERQLKKLRKRIKSLGNVNSDSLEHLDELQSRYTHLKTTMDDLIEARNHLNDLVEKIDKRCKEMFVETFDAIRVNFQDLFRRAFGGGIGDIVLEDNEDVLECGIDIVARPPGKELKSISLMSGGEKTLTAFAMLLAMFKHRPSPYCILDEVDAALDEANVERMLGLLTEFKDSTQFVIITHKKLTMTIADLLYGVTMEEAGISKRLTVKFENIGENGEFATDDQSDSQDQAA